MYGNEDGNFWWWNIYIFFLREAGSDGVLISHGYSDKNLDLKFVGCLAVNHLKY